MINIDWNTDGSSAEITVDRRRVGAILQFRKGWYAFARGSYARRLTEQDAVSWVIGKRGAP